MSSTVTSLRLPNASVGKDYQGLLGDLLSADGSRIEHLDVTLPENSGLAFDKEGGVIRGIPALAGELEVEVTLVSRATRKILLTVNPDPSSLWKNLPSDPEGRFAKPDFASGYLQTPDLHVIAASQRGRSHAHEGKYRDDDFAIHYLPESGWHLFAVADGAGSAEYSRRGSQIACQTVIGELTARLSVDNPLDAVLGDGSTDPDEALKRPLWDFLVVPAFEAHKAINREATDAGVEPKKFSTTLLVVIAKRFGSRWFHAGFSVGDGGSAVLDAGNLLPLSKPDGGEFSGQTLFVTHARIFEDTSSLMERVCFGFLPSPSFLALMTDGVTDPKFPSDSSLADPVTWEQFRTELTAATGLEAPSEETAGCLLRWLGFPSPGNHDDRTLVVAIPKQAARAKPESIIPDEQALPPTLEAPPPSEILVPSSQDESFPTPP